MNGKDLLSTMQHNLDPQVRDRYLQRELYLTYIPIGLKPLSKTQHEIVLTDALRDAGDFANHDRKIKFFGSPHSPRKFD